MLVANAVRLCGFNLNRALTKTINFSFCQLNCLRGRISDRNVARDNRVSNLIIQIGDQDAIVIVSSKKQ